MSVYACDTYKENKAEIGTGCHEKHTACMRMVSYNQCSGMKMEK